MSVDRPHGIAAVVLAKWPRPGRVKTRLCPPLDPVAAADLAAAALEDTFDAVAHARVERRVAVIDAAPPGWRRIGFDSLPQRGDGLDERLASAFADVGGPAVLVGMDTPQVTPSAIDAAATALLGSEVDAVLGPALDGGYWLIGLRNADDDVFRGVPMSRPDTCEAQLDRLHERGRRVVLLDMLRDVDDIDDAVAVAAEAPASRFARALDTTRARWSPAR